MSRLSRIYQSDAARFLDALQSAQAEREGGEAFDPRHDIRADLGTRELIFDQMQERIESAYQRDFNRIFEQFHILAFYPYTGAAQ